MRKIFYVLIALSLAACNNNEKTQAESKSEPQAALLTNPEHGQPGHDCALSVGAPLNQKASNPATATAPVSAPVNVPVTAEPAPAQQPAAPVQASGVKTNPAHGQPGHDCALPVGAPLK